MEKHYMNRAITYAIIAMVFGVFYREFTKFSGFTGDTSLSLMHTHYFMLGMIVFLILMFAQKLYSFTDKNVERLTLIYQIGLNITGLGFFARGMTQILNFSLSKGLDLSIAGISGIGHILLGISLICILFQISKKIDNKK